MLNGRGSLRKVMPVCVLDSEGAFRGFQLLRVRGYELQRSGVDGAQTFKVDERSGLLQAEAGVRFEESVQGCVGENDPVHQFEADFKAAVPEALSCFLASGLLRSRFFMKEQIGILLQG